MKTIVINSKEVEIPTYVPSNGQELETVELRYDESDPLSMASVILHIMENFEAYTQSQENGGELADMPTNEFVVEAMEYPELVPLVVEFSQMWN